MHDRQAVVVGAGPGGPAAAVALRRAGWPVQVLERAPAVEPVGAAISLWSTGCRPPSPLLASRR